MGRRECPNHDTLYLSLVIGCYFKMIVGAFWPASTSSLWVQ